MKRLIIAVAALAASVFAISCKKDEVSAVPGTMQADVHGTITNSTGSPVDGIKVTIEHTVWHNTYVYSTTDANGNYSKNLPADPAGDWTAKSQVVKTAYGQAYTFDLAPSSTGYFSKGSNATRNFTWRLSGQRPTGGYYGAHIDMYMCCGSGTSAQQLKLILTPVESTLIDGSAATTIEQNVVDIGGGVSGVANIPIGKYKVRAVVPGNPGKTIYLDYKRNATGTYLPEREVIFKKDGFLGETEYNLEFFFHD